jgi:hypothetical protein
VENEREHRTAIDIGIAALAVALIGAGAVAVFAVRNGTGAAALLTAGVALLALVILRERIETLRWGDLELTLRRQADVAAAQGDYELERGLRAAADSLANRAAPIAGSYETVRSSMPAGPERTAAMEAEVARAREDARSGSFDREQVVELFRTGTAGQRIYALGIMQEHPGLATVDVVLDAVRSPHSPFEHYHSLLLAERVASSLTAAEKEALEIAVRQQLDSRRFRRDSDRLSVANQILDRLGA